MTTLKIRKLSVSRLSASTMRSKSKSALTLRTLIPITLELQKLRKTNFWVSNKVATMRERVALGREETLATEKIDLSSLSEMMMFLARVAQTSLIDVGEVAPSEVTGEVAVMQEEEEVR